MVYFYSEWGLSVFVDNEAQAIKYLKMRNSDNAISVDIFPTVDEECAKLRDWVSAQEDTCKFLVTPLRRILTKDAALWLSVRLVSNGGIYTEIDNTVIITGGTLGSNVIKFEVI